MIIGGPSRILRWQRAGFSLPEVTVTAGIIGLLAAMATVGVVRYRQNAEDARMEGEMTSIHKAMGAYRTVYGRYPVNYRQLSQFISVPDFDRKYRINPNP